MMRRTIAFVGIFGASLVLAGLIWKNGGRAGQSATSSPLNPLNQKGTSALLLEGRGKTLPLSQVVLFNTGVGYFQREGKVDGNARLDLTFPASDINDLLKSLTLHDNSGQQVRAVSYQSQEPMERTLRSFAVDLTRNPDFGQLLQQARGERVEITLQGGGAGTASTTISGSIVGMEAHMEKSDEAQYLNVLLTDGVRRIPLAQIQRFRFLDGNLEQEFRRALDVLASSRNVAQRHVSLHCRGEGQRDLKIGYVVESPIWKASYRLILSKSKENKADLQGWAIVDNTTDEDWRDIRLTLVNTRPLSFEMDLYQPLFVPRPKIEPDQFAALRPPIHEGGLSGNLQLGMQIGGGFNVGGFNQGFNQGFSHGGMGIQTGLQVGQMAGMQIGTFPGMPLGQLGMNRYQTYQNLNNLNLDSVRGRLSWEELRKRREEMQSAQEKARDMGRIIAGLDPDDSKALIEGQNADPVQYTLDQKLSLPRQRSALLPVFRENIQAQPVSVFNENYHKRHPLRSVLLTNPSNQALLHGPVSVFNGSTYLGDARLPHLQPKEQRLLSFAIDIGVEVKSTYHQTPEKKLSLIIDRGVVRGDVKTQRMRDIVIRNRTLEDRELILEHPISSHWELTGVEGIKGVEGVEGKSTEKPVEKTRQEYRYRWSVKAGASLSKTIMEEQKQLWNQSLRNINDATLFNLTRESSASKQVLRVLEQVIERRKAVAQASKEVTLLTTQVEEIFKEDRRLREKLGILREGTDLHKRLLNQFEQQENLLERTRRSLESKRAEVERLTTDLEKWSQELTVS